MRTDALAGLSDKDIETTIRVLEHVCRALEPGRGVGMTAPLWLLTLITFSGTLAMHIFVPALPEAARALGASIGEMQLTMSVYIFGLAVGQLAYGPLSDRFGRRPVLVGGPRALHRGRPRRLASSATSIT